MSIQEFNSTLIDMINDLASAIPKFTDLNIVANLASSMFRLDPTNTTALDTFYPTMQEHISLIENREEDAILKILQKLLPAQYGATATYVWGELSPANKDTMWQYIDLLRDQAIAIKRPPPTQKGLPEESELFTVYNNIWKEFLVLLQKSEIPEKVGRWDTALKCLQGYASNATGKRSELHTAVKETLAGCLTSIDSPTDIMKLILPKDADSMKEEVDGDYVQLADVPFVLNKDITFGEVLDCVRELAASQEVLVYWHYLKVLTTVLGECPPQLADLLSTMTSSLTMQG